MSDSYQTYTTYYKLYMSDSVRHINKLYAILMTDSANIKRQFFDSLKRGTGEAFFILRDNPTIDFSDLIIKGATNNYAYDRQCESSRAKYVYGLIKLSKQQNKIIDIILTKLTDKKNDWYGLDQMCDLAVMFAKKGNEKVRPILYKRFQKNLIEGYEFCGQDALIELDGMKGLLIVAELIGKTLLNDPEDEEYCYRVDNFQKKNKSIKVYAELEKAGKKNKYIKAYLTSILKDKNTQTKRHTKIKRWTYELVKEKIDLNKFRVLSEERANELTIEEVKRLADEFLATKDKVKQEQYLRFFSYRKFPYNYKTLLKFASGKNSKGIRLVYHSVNALKFFKGNDIREFALQKIKTQKDPSDYLNLLVGNYKKDDYKLLIDIANKSDDYEYIHNIVFGFIDIYQANVTKDCKQPLEIIYNKMNCGLHRKDIVNLLGENGVLSDKIFNELQFDSYDEVRKLYRQKKNGI